MPNDIASVGEVRVSDAQRYVYRLAAITTAFIVDGILLRPLPTTLALALQRELQYRASTKEPRLKRIIQFFHLGKKGAQSSVSSRFEAALLRELKKLLVEPTPGKPKKPGDLEATLLRSLRDSREVSTTEELGRTNHREYDIELSQLIEAAIADDPFLQSQLAATTGYNPSKWLLEEELSGRKPRKEAVDESDSFLPPQASPSWNVEDDAKCSNNSNDVYNSAAKQQLTGLCLSGGGIRSATFCLGVLQTLGELKLLQHIDYLSSVSGGGYIHQWLASWIFRAQNGIKEVEEHLVPLPRSGCLPEEPQQIFWLRRFSSYLTPQRGLFSADTWTMIAIWLRNTSLIQIVLFSFLTMALLIARGLTYPYLYPPWIGKNSPLGAIDQWLQSSNQSGANSFASHVLLPLWQSFEIFATNIYTVITRHGIYGQALLLVLAIYFYATLYSALHSVAVPVGGMNQVAPPGALGNKGVFLRLVLPAAFLCFLLSVTAIDEAWAANPFDASVLWAINVLLLLLAITFGGQPYRTFLQLRFGESAADSPSLKQRYKAIVACALFVFAAIFISALLGWAANELIQALPKLDRSLSGNFNDLLNHAARGSAASTTQSGSPSWSVQRNMLLGIFALPIFSVLLFFASHLQIGILGRFYAESRREWLARFRAWSAMFCFGWMALTMISRLGPILYQWLFVEQSSMSRLCAALSFIAVHGATLYAGSSSKTAGKPSPTSFLGYKPLDLVGIVGAPLAIVLLLVVDSGLLQSAIVRNGSSVPAFFVLGFLLLVFGWRVDVNEFSLHAFYRNRLARCYLGATNSERTPDPFTGFDDHETMSIAGTRSSIAVADLLPKNFDPQHWQISSRKAGDAPPYSGPYPIFSCTLNLTNGKELAWQQRKAASFFFAPRLSGYHVDWTDAPANRANAAGGPQAETASTWNGFITTSEYAYRERGIQLPNAAAISGAALSPNQGYNSQPPLAFLMTLFNLRLGWWLANPRRPVVARKQANRPTPRMGLLALLSELFGMSGDQTDYICLSDGGFFDNMGLYELVRRRCRYIIVCDAEEDDEMTFGGIGMAIMKCRNDFGVEINLDLRPLQLKTNPGFSSSHFQAGTITYPPPPGSALPAQFYVGRLIYIKSSMVGDEPADLLAHKNAEPAFPQDITANQWFTESKFESYRRLGQLAACQALGSLNNPASRDALVSGFDAISMVPPPPAGAPTLFPGC